jgi:hypothetical protein
MRKEEKYKYNKTEKKEKKPIEKKYASITEGLKGFSDELI